MDIIIIGKVNEEHQPARVWCDVLEGLGHTVTKVDVLAPEKPNDMKEEYDVLILTQINNTYNPQLLPKAKVTIGYLFENPYPISFKKCDILVASDEAFFMKYSLAGGYKNCIPLTAPSLVRLADIDKIDGLSPRRKGLHFHGAFHCPKEYYNRMSILNELIHEGFQFDLLKPEPDPYEYSEYIKSLKSEEMQLVFFSDGQYTSGRLYENALSGALNIIHTPTIYHRQKLRELGFRNLENCFMFKDLNDMHRLFNFEDGHIKQMCQNAYELCKSLYTAESVISNIMKVAQNLVDEVVCSV